MCKRAPLLQGKMFIGRRVCISGPPSSGKTSLLFCQALHCAEKGRNVLYVAPSPLKSLPLVPHTDHSSLQPPSHLLQRIHFKYPANITEFLHILSNLHLSSASDNIFNSIVVDDLHKFLSPQVQVKGHHITSEVARACAYITDAVAYMEHSSQQDTGDHGTCKREHSTPSTSVALSLSSETPHNDMIVDVMRHWFPEILLISPNSSVKDREYILTPTPDMTPQLRYQLQYPFLQIMPNNNS